MILINANTPVSGEGDYAAFKAMYAELGGNNRTPVYCRPGVSAAVVADFSRQNVELWIQFSALPDGFAADFPQTMYVTNFGGFGGID